MPADVPAALAVTEKPGTSRMRFLSQTQGYLDRQMNELQVCVTVDKSQVQVEFLKRQVYSEVYNTKPLVCFVKQVNLERTWLRSTRM